jgi:cell division protein FtsB
MSEAPKPRRAALRCDAVKARLASLPVRSWGGLRVVLVSVAVEIEANLRVASDRLLRTLDQLATLENEKRTLEPSSARFQTLAKEIERLSSEIFAQSHAQQQLGQRARDVQRTQGVELPPINEATQTRDLSVILTEWRDAERRLSLAEADSAEHSVAAADAARLREEYQSVFSASAVDKSGD